MAKVAPQASETEDCILSAFESGMGGMLGEGITTVTFFNGDVKAAAEYLKQRLALVAAANPWIFGHLVKEKQHAKRAALRTPKVAPPVSEEVYELNEALKLSEEMPYEDMVKAVQKSSAYVPMGRKLLNKRRPVSKLSVAPTVGGGGFAVIFSLSHTVCNGGTYYQILNMLSSNGAIVAMDPRRKEELAEKPKEFMGMAHYAYLNGGTNALNGLGKIAFGKNPKAHCFLVDDAKLNAAKAEAKAKPGAPERISSNDVLTSAFASLCKSRVFIMAVDFKGKIEGTVNQPHKTSACPHLERSHTLHHVPTQGAGRAASPAAKRVPVNVIPPPPPRLADGHGCRPIPFRHLAGPQRVRRAGGDPDGALGHPASVELRASARVPRGGGLQHGHDHELGGLEGPRHSIVHARAPHAVRADLGHGCEIAERHVHRV